MQYGGRATCGWSQALCHEAARRLLVPLYEALQQRDRQPVAGAARRGGLRGAHHRAQLPAHQKLMIAPLQLRISLKHLKCSLLPWLGRTLVLQSGRAALVAVPPADAPLASAYLRSPAAGVHRRRKACKTLTLSAYLIRCLSQVQRHAFSKH